MDDKDIIDTIVITGADCEDSINIDISDLESNTITIDSSAFQYSTYNISTTAGMNGTSGQYLTAGAIGAAGSPVWTTSNSSPWSIGTMGGVGSKTLQVTGDAEFDGDVKIKGVSVAKTLEDIQKRLAILVPDPKKLEHFEALKKAYEHYKTLEALCEVPEKKDDGS
jgi:hypothetical protein